MSDHYRFVVAATPEQFEQIHRLNYRTFVEEIPHHEPNAERRLVDRFHAENTYVVCELEGRVVGMICVRDRRPFSVDENIGPFEDHLPAGVAPYDHPCEVRLLAIEPGHRHGRMLLGLFRGILEVGIARGYDLIVMSGLVANQRLYRALGFRPFGPLTGTPEAPFQPMYADRRLFALAQGRGAVVASLPAMLARAIREPAGAGDALPRDPAAPHRPHPPQADGAGRRPR